MTPDSPRTLVVGFGNPLMGDDGFGHRVIAELRRHPNSPLLRVEACAGDGLQLLGLWAGETRVWIVDALIRHAAPGVVHVVEHEELAAIAQRHEAAHQLSLVECLRLLPIARPEMARVRYRLWAVEPLTLEPGEHLSPAVAAAVPTVARSIRGGFGEICTKLDFETGFRHNEVSG